MKNNTSLISGTTVYLFSNILNASIPFIMLPILTRYLSPSEYGEVAMFQTLVAALAAFTGLSVHAAANRKYFDDYFEDKEMKLFIGSCLQILIASSSAFFLVLYLFKTQLSEWLEIRPEWILIAVFISAANFINYIRLGQWQVRNKAKLFGFFQVFRSLLDMLLSVCFVMFLFYGSDGRVAAQVLSISFFSVLAIFLLRKDEILCFFHWSPNYTKEALVFGLPLVPHIAGVFLLNSVDRFVINSELGLEQAGFYMVAVQFSMAAGIIFDSINKAYAPWLFEKLKQDVFEEKIRIVKFTYFYFFALILVAILVFFIGPFFVVLIAGEAYGKAGEVVGWLVLGQIFNGMYLMVTNYMFYAKKTGQLSTVTILSGAVNVALLFLLIEVFSLEGAAIAYCCSMALRFAATWFVSQKTYPMPWFNFKLGS